jgi:hypothetical protein
LDVGTSATVGTTLNVTGNTTSGNLNTANAVTTRLLYTSGLATVESLTAGVTTLASGEITGSLVVGGDFTIVGATLLDTDTIKLRATTKQTIGAGSGTGFVINRANSVASINGISDIITSNGHGFNEGQNVAFISLNTDVTGLSNNTIYRVVQKTDNTFKVASVGAYPIAIDFSTSGLASATLRDIDNPDGQIRWNEVNRNWELRDVVNTVDATAYSKILTANLISSALTSTSADTVLSSQGANTLDTRIVTANTNLKNYVDVANTSMKSYVDTANTNLKNYVDVANTSMKSYVDTANTSMKSYVDTANTSMKSYVDTANTNLKNYTDNLVSTANTNLKNYTDNLVSTANTNLKNYTDNLVSTANTNLKNYTDNLVSTANTNLKSYTDNLVSTANTNLKNYVDTENLKPVTVLAANVANIASIVPLAIFRANTEGANLHNLVIQHIREDAGSNTEGTYDSISRQIGAPTTIQGQIKLRDSTLRLHASGKHPVALAPDSSTGDSFAIDYYGRVHVGVPLANTTPTKALNISTTSPSIGFLDSLTGLNATSRYSYIDANDGNLAFFADIFQTQTDSAITFAVDTSTTAVRILPSDTAATSTTTGTMVVTGGVGISGAAFVGGNLSVAGNLLVSGTTTTINTAQLNIADNEFVLNSDLPDNVQATESAGITINRGANTNTYIRWNETTDTWVANNGITAGEFRLANTTTYLTEGTNLYLTAARVRANVGNTAPILYNSSTGVFSHATSGVTAATHGSSTSVPVFVVNDTGHITSVSNTAIAFPAEADTLATVTARGATTTNAITINNTTAATSNSTGALILKGGISGNANARFDAVFDAGNRVISSVSNTAPINAVVSANTLTLSHATSGVTATTYGTSIAVPVFAVNAEGHVTSVTNTTIRSATTSQTGVVQLEDSVTSTSTANAAVSNSVRTSYNHADGAFSAANTGAVVAAAAFVAANSAALTADSAFDAAVSVGIYDIAVVNEGSFGAFGPNTSTYTTTTDLTFNDTDGFGKAFGELFRSFIGMAGPFLIRAYKNTPGSSYITYQVTNVTKISTNVYKLNVLYVSKTTTDTLWGSGAYFFNFPRAGGNNSSTIDVSTIGSGVAISLVGVQTTGSATTPVTPNSPYGVTMNPNDGVFTINNNTGSLTLKGSTGSTQAKLTSGAAAGFMFTGNSVDIASISNDGIISIGDITSYGTPSDVNLKENIERIPNGLQMIESLNGYSFNYIGKTDRMIGVIAQELEVVAPELVYEAKNLETGKNSKAVRYAQITAILIEAVKTLSSEVKELKQEVDDIKKQLNNK